MKLFDLFKRNPEPPPPPTKEQMIAQLLAMPDRHTHDMRQRCYGHNIEKCGDTFALWTTPALRKGDKIITEDGLFVAFNVKRCFDPEDMVFADFFRVGDAPKEKPEETWKTGVLL